MSRRRKTIKETNANNTISDNHTIINDFRLTEQKLPVGNRNNKTIKGIGIKKDESYNFITKKSAYVNKLERKINEMD